MTAPNLPSTDSAALEARVAALEAELASMSGLLHHAVSAGQILLEWLQAVEVDRLAVMAAYGRRSATARDYLRRIVALDPRLLDSAALVRLGLPGPSSATELRLYRYAGAVRLWRDAWVQAVGHHLELGPPAPPFGDKDHDTWMGNRDLLATLAGLASAELAQEAVDTMEGMVAHLADHGSEPEHKEWAAAIKEWAVLWRRVAMTGPAGPAMTWAELTHHPDYVAVCARTTTLELAAQIVTTLGGLVAYFSDEARAEAS